MSFFLRGTYNLGGVKNPEVGIIDISELEEIRGHIMDPQSTLPRYDVWGNFCNDENNFPVLVFTKDPPIPLHSPSRYVLKKPDGKETIEGTYEGFYERTSTNAIRLEMDFNRSIGEHEFAEKMKESENKVKVTLDAII